MRITIIGGRNLGCTIAEGILSTKSNNFDITITRRNIQPIKYLNNYKKINITSENKAAISDADYVLLAIKPYQIQSVLKEIKPVLDGEKHKIISVVSG